MIMTIGGIRITIRKEICDKDDPMQSYTPENKHEKALERCENLFFLAGHTPSLPSPN